MKLDGPQQKRHTGVFFVTRNDNPPQEECLIRPIICTSIKPQHLDARPFWATLRAHKPTTVPTGDGYLTKREYHDEADRVKERLQVLRTQMEDGDGVETWREDAGRKMWSIRNCKVAKFSSRERHAKSFCLMLSAGLSRIDNNNWLSGPASPVCIVRGNLQRRVILVLRE